MRLTLKGAEKELATGSGQLAKGTMPVTNETPLPIANRKLLTAYCLLLIAYCSLPIAYCLLPIPTCQPPRNFGSYFAIIVVPVWKK